MAQILILVEQPENRRLLGEYLRQYYDVVIGDTAKPTATAAILNEPFDLCILDGVALTHLRQEIQSRKQQELPVFLPILLIALRPDIDFLTQNLWNSVDELIKKPIDKLELRVRVEMLLRSRRFSLQLDASSKRERESNELKSRFISIASHEFRNPLNRISGFTQLLENKQNILTEQRTSYLQRIQKAVDEMVTLLDNVLATIKSEANLLTFAPTLIALKPFCQKLIEEAKVSLAPSRIIDFVYEGRSVEAHFDEALLQQILTNLLSNALKYSSPNSTVYFRVQCQSEAVIFQIQDQGIGIAAQDQQKLFNSFYRATNVGDIPGTGLGLSIVRQAVERHEGTISLSSEINVGTTFTVMLPIASR